MPEDHPTTSHRAAGSASSLEQIHFPFQHYGGAGWFVSQANKTMPVLQKLLLIN